MRLLLTILATLAAIGLHATEAADSLDVRVLVEVTTPDGTRVTKNITTRIPDPGTDAGPARLIDAATAAVAPPAEPTVVIVRSVEVCEPDLDAAVRHFTTDTTAVADAPAPVIDPVTGQPVVELLPADRLCTDTIAAPRHENAVRNKWKLHLRHDPERAHFAWGAEAGSSIDLSANDMSSIDITAFFGLTWQWISFAGIGAGADMMISNSCRTYPLFVNFRTDFSRLVQVVFLDLRGGVALNYLPGNASMQSPYGAVSVGFNLATGRTFRSYILAGYTYNRRGEVTDAYERTSHHAPLSLATLRFGIQF